MIAIGSLHDSRPDAKLYSLALQKIATKLLRQRGETITHRSRMADFQTVLLLEVLSKYSARHVTPETSARFRAMFATLHQTRHILTQNPLAVFRTLKHDKNDSDLKRAHKFWLDHEARRRIFYACSVLDAQQVALFEQRPVVTSHASLSNTSRAVVSEVNLPCDEELWEIGPLVEWADKATSSVSRDIAAARASYQTASVGDYSFFQHQIINLDTDPTQRCLEEISSPPQQNGPLSKTRFNHHVFQMAKNTPLRALLVVAGESWFLGRKVEQEAEYIQAKHIVREWIGRAMTSEPSVQAPTCLKAHWHASRVLRMLLGSGRGETFFRTTNLLHENWAVYLAALVCWAHAYARRVTANSALQSVARSPTASRKRKNTDSSTPSRKRQDTGRLSVIDTPPLSVAAHSTRQPYSMPSMAHDTTDWSPYGPVSSFNGQWPDHYGQSQFTYSQYAQHEAGLPRGDAPATATDSSAYGSTTRTATNTPLSQTTATTGATVTAAASDHDNLMAELRTYLHLTNVSSPQELATLSDSTLSRTRSALEAIRIYKIGAERNVGGLMNDADGVLRRLVEGKSSDMF